jgi:Arc/MetJ-type ribon-helix-helix transcriptional regulator
MTNGYTLCMTTQIAVKLPDELVAAIDALVADGQYASRSEAFRVGVEALVADARRRRIDEAFARGFARIPDSPDEIAEANRLGLEAINEEPWEKWW